MDPDYVDIYDFAGWLGREAGAGPVKAACEKLQVFVADNPEADLQKSTSLVDLS